MESSTILALLCAALVSSAAADYNCGGTFSGLKPQIITSRYYPSLYRDNENCEWVLRPGVSGTVHLVFTAFQTEGCQDYVAVFRATSGSRTQMLKLCHDNVYPASTSAPVRFTVTVTESQFLTINFRTDHSVTNNGFRLIVYTVETGTTYITETLTRPTKQGCLNGGLANENVCRCPPGFGGPSCERSCGPDHYGESCEDTCTGKLEGCKSLSFCIPALTMATAVSDGDGEIKAPCTCAAGLRGANCDKVCGPGNYGANCSQICGFCKNQAACDPYRGHCVQGCQPGYHPPYCQQGLTHLWRGLTIASVTNTLLSGSVLVSPSNVAGQGDVTVYELQYRETPGGRWTAGAFGQIQACNVTPCDFTVDGLRPNTTLDVRVLLLNDDMESFKDVPYLTTRTQGQRQVSELVVTNITARSFRVSWTSPVNGGPFCVMYGCDALLACPGMRCDYSDGMLFETSQSLVLQNLIPFTRYTITVAVNDQSETATATTIATVPDTEVSDLETRHVTNTTAVVRWRDTDSCEQLNGPATNYRWELHRGRDPDSTASTPPPANRPVLRTGATNSLVVVLRDLDPLTWYEFRVNIINALGGNPERWAVLRFRTLHTVPDAPGEPAVYRKNQTTLWMRWVEPPRPSGNIVRYVIECQGSEGSRKETVSPNSHCAAKVGFVCHAVFGLLPNTDYTVTIRAVNEHGDEPGEPATLRARTTVGESGPPQYLRVKETRPRSVVLEWQLPDLLNSDLHSFDLVVSPVRGVYGPPRRFEMRVTEEKLMYEYSVDGLQPGAVYVAEVRCGFKGEMAQTEFTTLSE